MKRAIFYLSAILFLQIFHPNQAFSQEDSLKAEAITKIEYDLLVGVDRYLPLSDNREVYLPDYIRQNRVGFSRDNFHTYTDIPQFHASVYAGLVTKLSVKNKLEICAIPVLEQRGHSFGFLNRDNFLIYPIIYGTFNETIQIKNNPVEIFVKAGDLMNYQLFNGLTVQHIDVQALDFNLIYKDLAFKYVLMADLSQHIGLNIVELYAFGLNYNRRLSSYAKFDVDLYHLDIRESHQDNNQPFYGLKANFFVKNTGIFRFESSFRANPSHSLSAKAAGLLEYSHAINRKRIKANIAAGYRYYGRYFNENFIDRAVRYRDPGSRIHGNYYGNYVYPLMNMDRPVLQWSLFTEYQGRNVNSFYLNPDIEYRLNKAFSLVGSAELLGVDASELAFANYVFYAVASRYKLNENMYFQIELTNKLMNLDIHYPTFYQAKIPIIAVSFRKEIPKLW